MYEIAPDVYLLKGVPDFLINVYLIGDVLLDAGTKLAGNGILRQLHGRTVNAHALTHVHPDHQGASKQVCETLNIPLWCGALEAEAMETGEMPYLKDTLITRLQSVIFTGAPYPVARRLQEGDQVAGFTILDAPGHSPGQIVYWREKDRVLILGDVLNNINLKTLRPGLHEPPYSFSTDPAQNRDSARKLAKLKPRIVCFGHGKPLMNGADAVRFIEGLPD
jgi:hydroxyacylglutathione hydrolase